MSTTPFGCPVLPEVYCRKPVCRLEDFTGMKEGSAEKSAGTITARSDSTCARNSHAIGFACGMVTMSEAPQLFRMHVPREVILDRRAAPADRAAPGCRPRAACRRT